MPRDPIDQVHQIVLDTTVVATTIAPALHQMNQSVGGYPATAVGASPLEARPDEQCTHRDTAGDNDCTESRPCPTHDNEAIERSDKALSDRATILRILLRLSRDAALAAKICTRWGLGGVDASTVKQSLNDALSGIWCANCSQHGYNNRRTNGEYCEFCSGIKSKYKRYPNARLLAIHATGRRILPSDVKRCFDPPRAAVPTPVPSLADARERRAKRIGQAS